MACNRIKGTLLNSLGNPPQDVEVKYSVNDRILLKRFNGRVVISTPKHYTYWFANFKDAEVYDGDKLVMTLNPHIIEATWWLLTCYD